MALPSSGQLSMSQINAEFGRGNDLNSYRGTIWYTPGGSQGYFSNTNLSFSEFWDKQPNSPAPSLNMSYLRYSGYTVAYVGWSLSSAYPNAYWELWQTYTNSGLPANFLVDSGYTDASGYADRSYTVSDGYWFPPPKTNCFDLNLSGYGWVGTYCVYGY